MSWATYGTWVYRVDYPPGAQISVRSAIPRFVDIAFDSKYQLYGTHAQRISSEPRVPMFEGFTMPPLTHDTERNAMYKQVQCRPVAVQPEPNVQQTADELVLNAFKTFSTPKDMGTGIDKSVQAHRAFTKSYLEWATGMETEAQVARHRFAARFEYPSLWETQEMIDELEWKLKTVNKETLPTIQQDFDSEKPRCTVSMYSSLLAQERIANLEGLARARQSKPKRRRDEDARLQEEYLKMHTLGEGGENELEMDNDENIEAVLGPTTTVKEVFPPITLKLTTEEQKKLLRFDLQGRKTEFVKSFLQQTWMTEDMFGKVLPSDSNERQPYKKLLADLATLDKDCKSVLVSVFGVLEKLICVEVISKNLVRSFYCSLHVVDPARMNAQTFMQEHERRNRRMWT